MADDLSLTIYYANVLPVQFQTVIYWQFAVIEISGMRYDFQRKIFTAFLFVVFLVSCSHIFLRIMFFFLWCIDGA